MKSKFFTLFAAFVLLSSAQASAQVNGDVNEDGVVNEQDIAAIIQIMQEAGGVKEQTKYYWYAGWTEPTAANIATIVNEKYPKAKDSTEMNPAGMTSTKLDGQEINFTTNPIYDQVGRDTGNKKYYYIVVPTGHGILSTTANAFFHNSTTTFEVVRTFNNHTVYKFIQNTSYIITGWKLCEVK